MATRDYIHVGASSLDPRRGGLGSRLRRQATELDKGLRAAQLHTEMSGRGNWWVRSMMMP